MSQFVLYGLFGGLGVIADVLVYTVMITIGAPYASANIAGYVCGTLISFALNRNLNFRVFDRLLIRLMAFLGVAAIGLMASSVALWLLIEQAGVGPVIAKILTLPLVVGVQFSLNRLVTFRTKTPPKNVAGFAEKTTHV